jgi:hypothetical protein
LSRALVHAAKRVDHNPGVGLKDILKHHDPPERFLRIAAAPLPFLDPHRCAARPGVS